jgi:hypothetical protein
MAAAGSREPAVEGGGGGMGQEQEEDDSLKLTSELSIRRAFSIGSVIFPLRTHQTYN